MNMVAFCFVHSNRTYFFAEMIPFWMQFNIRSLNSLENEIGKGFADSRSEFAWDISIITLPLVKNHNSDCRSELHELKIYQHFAIGGNWFLIFLGSGRQWWGRREGRCLGKGMKIEAKFQINSNIIFLVRQHYMFGLNFEVLSSFTFSITDDILLS